MLLSVGTDILKVERIEQMGEELGERFMRRILTPAEQAEFRASAMPNRLLAKRFAAKEAVAKALGTGIGHGVSWQDIEICHNDKGAPWVQLSGAALQAATARGGSRVELSLSDETDYVVAFAVLTV